ncbi:MAG: hypothetical protein ABII27_02420 [bacterium]
MKNLKKDPQSVTKELNALAKKVNQIVVAVGKLDKPKTAKKPKAKAVKRKSVKKTVVKKVAVKKPAAKKPGQLTAVDTVLGFINRSKKGIDTAALAKKTGFSQKKIHNIVYKLKKQDKVKSEGKGFYVKA